MWIIGVDLHARQQSNSMVNMKTGEVMESTLQHEGKAVREFYARLPRPLLVGLEATGSMYWFLALLEELGTFAALSMGGSSAPCRASRLAVATLLSAKVRAKRDGKSSCGRSAKAGHSAVDHDARPDRLSRVLPPASEQKSGMPMRECLTNTVVVVGDRHSD
jgi:hypothetical protein